MDINTLLAHNDDIIARKKQNMIQIKVIMANLIVDTQEVIDKLRDRFKEDDQYQRQMELVSTELHIELAKYRAEKAIRETDKTIWANDIIKGE